MGAKGALRKILRSVSQKWISQNSTKGGLFGSAGGQIPEEGHPPPLPPKSATGIYTIGGYIGECFCFHKCVIMKWTIARADLGFEGGKGGSELSRNTIKIVFCRNSCVFFMGASKLVYASALKNSGSVRSWCNKIDLISGTLRLARGSKAWAITPSSSAPGHLRTIRLCFMNLIYEVIIVSDKWPLFFFAKPYKFCLFCSFW